MNGRMNTSGLARNYVCAALGAVLSLQAGPLLAAGPSAEALLKQAADAAAARPAYAFEAESREYFGEKIPEPSEQPNQGVTFSVKVEGRKMDVRSTLRMLDRETGALTPHVEAHYVWDERLYWRNTQSLEPGEVPWIQAEEGDYYPSRLRANPDYGAFLEGYFMHNYDGPWYALLANEPGVRLEAEAETVDGAECRVLTAVTRHGDYRLWIDPAASYLLRRAQVIVSRDDFAWGQPLTESHKPSGGRVLKTLELEMRDVSLTEIGGYSFGTGGTLVQRFRYEDGSTSQTTKIVRRSNLRLLGQEEWSTAFTLNLAEGDLVEYVYLGGTILDHRWKNGALEPVLDQITLDQINASLPQLSTLMHETGTLAALQGEALREDAPLLRLAGDSLRDKLWLFGIALLALGGLTGMGRIRKGTT